MGTFFISMFWRAVRDYPQALSGNWLSLFLPAALWAILASQQWRKEGWKSFVPTWDFKAKSLLVVYVAIFSFVLMREIYEEQSALSERIATLETEARRLKQSSLESHTPSLFFRCDQLQLPIRYVSQPRIDIIDTGANSSRQQLFFTPTREPIWPSTAPKSSRDLIQQCRIVNYSSFPVFNLRIPMKVVLTDSIQEAQPGKQHLGHYTATYESGLELYSGAEVGAYEYSLEIPELNGNDGEHIFYFFNGTVNFAFLTPPDIVDLESGKSGERLQAPLRVAFDLPKRTVVQVPNLDTKRKVAIK